MSKEKDVQVLEYKISELDEKIILFTERGISEKKIKNLEMLKLKYETQLEEIQYA